MSSPVFVYVICHHDGTSCRAPVKVGIAGDPFDRIAALQTGNPNKLTVFAGLATPSRGVAVEIEGAFHDLMPHLRLSGEWFSISPEDAVVVLRQIVMDVMVEISGTCPSEAAALLPCLMLRPIAHARHN